MSQCPICCTSKEGGKIPTMAFIKLKKKKIHETIAITFSQTFGRFEYSYGHSKTLQYLNRSVCCKRELLENKLLPEQQKHTVLALTSPCGPSPFYLTCVSFLLKVDTASPARLHLRSGSVGTGGWRTPVLLKAVPHAVIWGSTGCLARLPLDNLLL